MSKMKADTWKTILQIAISFLTAIATSLGISMWLGLCLVSKYSLTVTPPNVVVASGLKIVILLVLLVGRFFGSADFRLQNIDCLFDCRRIGDAH